MSKTDSIAKGYDPGARGSDIARTKAQYIARKIASAIVGILRLNSGGFFSTEIAQQINPVCKIPTKAGDMFCRGGHGRLRWRAETFFLDEPETIEWLDMIGPDDLLWDIGANVGLYAIYAAKVTGCRVVAFEPEAQNFAILMENIALNGLEDRVTAAMMPIIDKTGLGKLLIHAMTKGGAWNRFKSSDDSRTINSGPRRQSSLTQVLISASIDDLIDKFGLECPTHIKIDTDGNEPEIIGSARNTLKIPRLRHIMVEEERGEALFQGINDILRAEGFKDVSSRVTGGSRPELHGDEHWVWRNLIFERPPHS